jgi:hypothetical protein
MTARSTTLANAVVDAINAWGSKPANITASRVRSVTHLINEMSGATVGHIAVIVSQVNDASDRADVAEEVVLGIVIIANCEGETTAASDSWDDFTELLRDHLRTSSAFKSIGVGSIAFQRTTVSTITVADAQMLDQSEIFISATEAAWRVSIGNRG